MNNLRDTNYFTKSFTSSWYDEWLLINEKSDINSRPKWKLIRSWLQQHFVKIL